MRDDATAPPNGAPAAHPFATELAAEVRALRQQVAERDAALAAARAAHADDVAARDEALEDLSGASDALREQVAALQRVRPCRHWCRRWSDDQGRFVVQGGWHL